MLRKAKREEVGFHKDDFVVISVGELNDNKNHIVIIDAIKKCGNPSIKYVICGIGHLEKELKDKIREYGLENQVFLLGFRGDIKELLWMSDVFAFPSKREGLGLAAIEAMAAGLPLITSNIHGIRDYSQNGKTGYAVSPNNVEEYANSIRKLLDDKKRIEYGRFCAQESRRFDLRETEKIMKKVYLEKGKGSREMNDVRGNGSESNGRERLFFRKGTL